MTSHAPADEHAEEAPSHAGPQPDGRAVRVVGLGLSVVIVGTLLPSFSAAGAVAVVFVSDVLSRWTGLPVSHLLGAMIGVGAAGAIAMVLVATIGEMRDAVDRPADTCEKLSEDRVARRLARALEDADEWIDTHAIPERKRPRRRRRSA